MDSPLSDYSFIVSFIVYSRLLSLFQRFASLFIWFSGNLLAVYTGIAAVNLFQMWGQQTLARTGKLRTGETKIRSRGGKGPQPICTLSLLLIRTQSRLLSWGPLSVCDPETARAPHTLFGPFWVLSFFLVWVKQRRNCHEQIWNVVERIQQGLKSIKQGFNKETANLNNSTGWKKSRKHFIYFIHFQTDSKIYLFPHLQILFHTQSLYFPQLISIFS